MSANHESQNFGFTILDGMNSNSHTYNRHVAWNENHDETTTPYSYSSPLPTDKISDYGDVIVNSTREADAYGINTIFFNAEAWQLYTIIVGGYKNGSFAHTNDDYTLQVEASAVPLPAAIWLFSSALTDIGVVRCKPKPV
ncbi:hypothetical protein BMETH_436_0 [methanotrophic bacterial endosymbiont of Bathymodiolus sp.]|nr:hypothetical protein BMETH_436_0 [methanotrophic bacterial endosymbiont of Bathymodiolus sp.]